MFRHTTWALFASSCSLLALACYAPTTHAGGWGVLTKPTTDVDRLATQIDKLERHLEEYGSVVPKTPDVWGEARLTKYRKVVEKELAGRENSFTTTINGAISRSDQAFLASTMALQAAVSGRSAVMTTPISNVITSTTSAGVSRTRTDQVTQQRIDIPDEGVVDEQPEVEKIYEKIDGTAVNFGTTTTINLEPTLDLNQRFRYLQHLNEFRRINDGDDTSDSPGYALHLIRIPVSILPGRKTEEGYGAEISITATPHLHDKLLQVTFKQLVINDIVDQMAFPLAKFLDSADGLSLLERSKQLKERENDSETSLADITKQLKDINSKLIDQIVNSIPIEGTPTTQLDKKDSIRNFINNNYSNQLEFHPNSKILFEEIENNLNDNNTVIQQKHERIQRADDFESRDDIVHRRELLEQDRIDLESDIESLNKALESIANESLTLVSIAPFRKSTLPFPQSRLLQIYGAYELEHIASLAKRLKGDEIHEKQVNLLDVNKLLYEELQAAFAFLNANPDLWSHCTPVLAQMIHSNKLLDIESLRLQFRSEIDVHTQDKRTSRSQLLPLSWAIIVESALLNERLIEDMNEISVAKSCQCLNRDWLPYFMPNPPPEAIHNFNEYIRCRWPVHVFAVDPITEDQNIADSFAQRREMQLALSMAFTSGRMSAQKFLRYARQTSLDVDTIALNRTVVGFSHGDDTFGWRFYPRVQTPRTPGNATVVFRDMLYGGLTQDQLLCQRRLEPGQRECTALVIMPSFVPYCTFDMRSNWFKLTNAKKKELDLRDGVGISRDIVALKQMSAQCIKQAHLYRAEDMNQLTRTVEQLERRLPLQTSYVQIPYENTLGGFEFFNTGVTDLAPELKGFYGEPGIDTSKDTTIFVVGDHFSIHETQVIAGNQCSPLNGDEAVPASDVRFELLSRQIMRVTIPKDTHTYPSKDASGAPLELVDLHVATPYGVSNHLSIPVIKSAATAATEAAQKTAKEEVAAANQKLLENMGMSYQWMDNYALEAGFDSKTKQVSLLDSTPDSLGVIREGQQIGLFNEGVAEIAFFITGIAADGKPIPNQIARISPKVLNSTPNQFNAPGNSVLDISRTTLNQIITEGLTQNVFPEVPPAVLLQGFIRFKQDGAPVIKLNNHMTVKLIKSQTPASTPVATFLDPQDTPFSSPRPSLADRYRIPQQATITPPLIAQ